MEPVEPRMDTHFMKNRLTRARKRVIVADLSFARHRTYWKLWFRQWSWQCTKWSFQRKQEPIAIAIPIPIRKGRNDRSDLGIGIGIAIAIGFCSPSYLPVSESQKTM
jgi:hypothetical protein